jgi:hypothetical protein
VTPREIAYCAIHPGIGIGRVGNSPSEYFIGPEAPGLAADPLGTFKDGQGRVKRQAARFRVYAYDEKDKVIGELTSAHATITWTVHLANKKASWYQFQGLAAEQQAQQTGQPLPLRNAAVADRSSLVIDPGPRTITGANVSGDAYQFVGGTFLGTPVPLGEVRTDGAGRLLVLGGFGHSESVLPDNPILNFANNDGWHDDVSDGPVTATVVLPSGATPPVKPAWMVVAPPDFAPWVDGIVTLYDVAYEVALGQGWVKQPTALSFTNDVYPILARVAGYTWVNGTAFVGHRAGPRQGPDNPFAQERVGDFLAPRRLQALSDNTKKGKAARTEVFNRVRNVSATGDLASQQASFFYMPQLSGDGGFATPGDPSTWFSLTATQYAMLERWAAGDFESDWGGQPPLPEPLGNLPVDRQPAALDRAALEHGMGGPFFPGIEMTYISRDPSYYSGPFRLRDDLEAGDAGKRMAVPWQADFYECQTLWWPAQRPDDVITEAEFDTVTSSFSQDGQPPDLSAVTFNREKWDRGVGATIDYVGQAYQAVIDNYTQGDNDMVNQWNRLGFVVQKSGRDGSAALVETERTAYAGLKDRDYFHIMLNLDAYPDFLPMAKALADSFLAQAASLQDFPFLDDELRFFPYSERALDARLAQIYDRLVDEADTYAPDQDPVMSSRERVVELIRQTSPFNQTDGGWLRNIAKAGPTDEVHALLFSIWSDEAGNGDPRLNHANLFTDLMHSVGLYPDPIGSRAYSDDATLLDSAFTVPLMELVLSQFTDFYFPEIMGMTLQLEWEVLDLKKTIKLFEAYGLDPHFYRMHVGIDNASDGHGAKARRAVQLYLDEIRADSGEQAVQEHWKRIWNGYVAFRATGTFGQDFYTMFDPKQQPSLTEQVAEMIQRKAPYARLNHDAKRLGVDLINDLFTSPGSLLRALLQAGLIVPGNPDESPFFNLLNYDGPMYKVFTEEEIKLWSDWTRSLSSTQPQPQPPDNSDVAALMVRLIKTMAPRQEGTPGHAANQLTGPDPSDPTKTVTQPVGWWFGQPVTAFMTALANPDNGWITPGNSSSSRFVTELLSGDHPMAHALGEVAPGTAHRTWRTIAISWIDAGCPIPSEAFAESVPPRQAAARAARLSAMMAAPDQPVPRLSLLRTPDASANHPRGTVLGMGLVH